MVMFGCMLAGTSARAQTTRTLTITPDTGLTDGDTVTLHGTGFTPFSAVYYCEGVFGASPTAADCGTGPFSTNADASGEFTAPFSVDRVMNIGVHGSVDCAQPGANCGIGAEDFFAPEPGAVAAPISFTSQPPIELSVSGTVFGGTGAPFAGVKVWAYVDSDGFVPSRQTVTDSDGNYAFDDLDANVEYRLWYGPPSGSGVVPLWYQNREGRFDAIPVKLSYTTPTTVLGPEFLFFHSGHISGTVTDATGAPLAGVQVLAYRPYERWAASSGATTGADGTYEIDDALASPGFRVRFVPPTGSGLAPEWFDDQPNRGTATDLTITDSAATTGIDAQLAPLP
jgi:hypothetical protein